jgi:hypothetical protein
MKKREKIIGKGRQTNARKGEKRTGKEEEKNGRETALKRRI